MDGLKYIYIYIFKHKSKYILYAWEISNYIYIYISNTRPGTKHAMVIEHVDRRRVHPLKEAEIDSMHTWEQHAQ